MFQIYVNDIHNGVNSYINLFADDAKLLRVIKTRKDVLLLQQEDINKIYEWSRKWKLEFNAKKCHVMELRKSKRRPVWNYLMDKEQIMKTKEERGLKPRKHISKIFELTYKMLTNIRVVFQYLDKDMMKKLLRA